MTARAWSRGLGRLVTSLVVGIGVTLALVSPASADQAKAVFTTNVSQVKGAIVDPAGRTWVADRVAGFCRVSEPASDTSPGTIETSTCVGGTLAGHGAGAATAGAPAFVDPTSGSVGSGDEMVLIPDSASGSADVTRARWNASTSLFVYHSTLQLHDGDLRPRAVSVGSDGDAYVIFERARAIIRVERPTLTQPVINVVAYASANGPLAIAASEVKSGSRVTVYVAESSGLKSFIPPARDDRSTQNLTSSYNVGAVSALLYHAPSDMLYAGTATATATGQDVVKQVNTANGTIDATWATGYTRVTGLGIRNAKLMVADDAGLLTNPTPTGTGNLYLLQPAVVRIVSGPTSADGSLAPDPTITNDSTPTFTVASEPAGVMQCSLVATGSAAVWSDCSSGTYTPTSAKTAGAYTFSVRSGTDGVPSSQNFTIDLTAPAAPTIGTPAEGQVVGSQILLDALGETGAVLKCALDSAEESAYATCASGETLTFTTQGPHVLRMKAIDRAGNVSPVTVRNFVVDTAPPTVTITVPAADGAVVDLNTSIEFTSPDADVTGFECQLDAGAFVACTSPKAYSNLSEGAHTFTVKVTDAAGNNTTATRSVTAADQTPPVVTPTPPGGEYPSGTAIVLSANEIAAIHYTVDGSTPTTASPQYSPATPITVTADFTLKYFGVDLTGNSSAVESQEYTVDVTPPLVTADPPAGSVPEGTSVTLAANEVAAIHYTVDGSEPTAASPTYTDPIVVTTDVTIRFIGIDAAGNTSSPVSAAYTALDATAPVLSTSPLPGTYPAGRLISILANEPATIHYTTNGSTPTVASPTFSAPIELTANVTIKAIGVDTIGNVSAVATFVFTVGQTFADVAPGDFFFADIDWLYSEGITRGADGPNGTYIFGPADPITREAMAAFVYRFNRQPAFTPPTTSPFTDLPYGDPLPAFYPEITWLEAEDIEPGGGAFTPSGEVTRGVMAVWVFRALTTAAQEAAYVPSGTEPFTDVDPTHPLYKEISWMYDTGLSTGADDGNGNRIYAPDDSITREAMAAFFHRADTAGFRP